MTDDYKIVIRCDHVTREGVQKTPIIAQAFHAGDEWHYTSRANTSVKTSTITDARRLVRSMGRAQRAAVYSVDIQWPETEMQNGDEVRSAPGPDVDRVVIRCAYPSCGESLARHKSALDQLLDKARHAGIHSLPLSYLRANV